MIHPVSPVFTLRTNVGICTAPVPLSLLHAGVSATAPSSRTLPPSLPPFPGPPDVPGSPELVPLPPVAESLPPHATNAASVAAPIIPTLANACSLPMSEEYTRPLRSASAARLLQCHD